MNIEAGRESGFFYVRPSYSSVILTHICRNGLTQSISQMR